MVLTEPQALSPVTKTSWAPDLGLPYRAGSKFPLRMGVVAVHGEAWSRENGCRAAKSAAGPADPAGSLNLDY